MTNPQQLLSVWTKLRKKLMTTLTELKVNHKDKWTLVKSKSVPDKLTLLKIDPKTIDRYQLTSIIQDKEEYLQELRMANEKHDRLNDKLNHLRTLVRAGDINQLQDLVRQGKI